MNKLCIWCNIEFIQKSKTSKFCSNKCSQHYHNFKRKNYFREYVIKNSDKLKQTSHDHYIKNPDYYKNYYKNNRDKILLQMKEINQNRKPRKNELSRIRYNSDPQYKLRILLSTAIYRTLKGIEHSKMTSFRNLVPYSIEELKAHLEKQFTPQMNWNNYGPVWHVDHKTPADWFQNKNELLDYGFSFDNLHPVLKEFNLSKNSNYCSDVMLALRSIGR